METTPASRSESVSSTECSCSWRSVKLTASAGTTASESSIRSPNSLSPSSPSGVCSEIGSPAAFLAAVLLDLDDLLGGHVELLGQLLRGGLAAQVLEHLALDAGELVDDLDHVHRDADGAGLVGHRPGDRLPDPPRRVRGELVALGVVELLDGADQPEVALLDEVQEEHAPAGVALGQRDDEAQVRLEQVVLRAPTVFRDPLQLAQQPGVELLAGVQRLLGEQAGLDPLGELDLLLGVEEGDLADLLEVVLHGVRGRTGGRDLLRR